MSQQYTFAALLTYGKPVNGAFKIIQMILLLG